MVKSKIKLPSAHQINEVVSCELLAEKYECRIHKVHFDESKVMYDLVVRFKDANEDWQYTRIYNIDSYFVR